MSPLAPVAPICIGLLEDVSCTICMEDFKLSESVFSCVPGKRGTHFFHKKCIKDVWLHSASSQLFFSLVCPVCRGDKEASILFSKYERLEIISKKYSKNVAISAVAVMEIFLSIVWMNERVDKTSFINSTILGLGVAATITGLATYDYSHNPDIILVNLLRISLMVLSILDWQINPSRLVMITSLVSPIPLIAVIACANKLNEYDIKSIGYGATFGMFFGSILLCAGASTVSSIIGAVGSAALYTGFTVRS